MPKARSGAWIFPSFLVPRRSIDHALHAVIMEACVAGVSTGRVDDLLVALGGWASDRYFRLPRIQSLLRDGRLAADLRWR